MKILRFSFAVLIVYLFCLSFTQQHKTHDVSQWAKSRQKRFLVFTTQGVHKFIISFVLHVDLKDRKPWRSLFGAWNFQWQHLLPLFPQQWWNSTYFPATGRKRSIGDAVLPTAPLPTDLTATLMYATIESYMNSKGMAGRECLLRAICENAQVHYVGGVLDRIYQRLLTPEKAMEEYYHDAYATGERGADCFKTYFACPKGESAFDQFVFVEEVV